MAPDAVHALSTQLQSTLFACARGGASGAGGDAARGDVPLWRLATEAEACSELRALPGLQRQAHASARGAPCR